LGLITSCKGKPTLATQVIPGISVGITENTCPNVTIRVGEQLTWTNQGQDEHIVRAIPIVGVVLFDSGNLAPGDSFKFKFTEPISYTYECSANGSLKGLVTVER
jgi:plastocyanin